ncbi:MAG TPA: hypothetical protein DCS97_04305, partial [Planctomycetes bacterium]|nr:hypothetical protein [Planctomycetota bacterium]
MPILVRQALRLCCLLLVSAALVALDSFPGTGNDSEYTIPIEVSAVSESPASITFKLWRAGQYDIYRKAPASTTWGTRYAQTGALATFWTDSSVTLGTEYEYRFQLITPNPPTASDGFPSGDLYNYLRAGVKIDRTGARGRIVLLVAEDLVATLPTELARYEQDLVGDGWIVHRIQTVRGETIKGSSNPFTDAPQFAARTQQAIRNQIKALYATHGSELKHVMILGRVPAMRAGNVEFRPDGHGNHGARGTDFYYAELNNESVWTDTVNNSATFTSASDPNQNLPSDGKLDFSRTPTTDLAFLELGFSRMDLGMRRDEFNQLKTFFDKLHRYKHADASFRPGRKFVYRSGYDNPGETWWHTGGAISGLANMQITGTPPTHPTLGADEAWTREIGPVLFYNRGSGSPETGTGGKALMWTGMQSYYGYWFETDAMPARLGEDSFTLSWCWSIWGLRYFYHPLGTGDVMGEMMRISANNRGFNTTDGLYRYDTDYDGNGNATGLNFMNHIGDAAMRLFMFPPPSNLAVNPTGSGAQLTWTATEEPGILGYHIYRSASAAGPFTKLTATPVAATNYTDAATTSGTATYMVRAVKLETTGSGTFLNPSQGVFQTVTWDAPAALAVSTTTLPDAYLRTAYSATLAATGGVPPYTWSVSAGALPGGLGLDANRGVISGTATAAGTANFTVRATDVKGVTATKALTLTTPNAVAYQIPILADARTESWNDTYDGYGTLVMFDTPTGRGYFLKYNLSSLPAGAITKAVLRVVVMDPSAASGSLTWNLTANANDVWAESTAGASSTSTAPAAFLTRNNRPPINSAAGNATYTGSFPNGLPIDIDVTALVQHDWANDPAKILGLTATLSSGTAYIATKENTEGYRLAPQLFVYVQGNPPVIALDSPASGAAAVNVGQSLAFATTVTDDGLPGGPINFAWTKVSGPGAATFSAPAAEDTAVSFNAAGAYVVRLTANDGAMASTRDVSVTVNDASLPGGPIPDLAWFNFEETSGTTVANSVAGNPNGTLVNATAAAWTASGRTGRGLDLRQESGIAHVVAATNGAYPISPTDSWTISVWVKKPDLNASWSSIFAKYMNPGTEENELSVDESGSTRISGTIGGASSFQDIQQGLFYDGGWHLVTLRNRADLANSRMTLYVDGGLLTVIQSPSYSAPGTVTTLADLLIGARRGANNSTVTNDWDGVVDDFRIYGRALSDSEVMALYQQSAIALNKPPVVSIATSGAAVENAPFALDGSATDDGLPAGSSLTYQWSKVSGPGAATFSAPSAADTTVTVNQTGSYTFRLIASDGELAGAKEINVFFDWTALPTYT